MSNNCRAAFFKLKLMNNFLSVMCIIITYQELHEQYSNLQKIIYNQQQRPGTTPTILQPCWAIAPTIDYSHNMRILNLPKSTPVGSIIYRLKGSDADPHSHLLFGVVGIEGRSLIDIRQAVDSWNEADVYLKAPLRENVYNLTIFVTDGNKTTQVESTIYVINDEFLTTSLSPFIAPKLILTVPENTLPQEVIGHVSVLESIKSDLPVRFELRGSDKFSIRYVFGPQGQSKAEITVNQPLDYEKRNMYQLVIIALNAWSNTRYDTRNIATLDLIVAVQDVQDTPPIFRDLPTVLRLNRSHQIDDIILKVFAEDGDYADQRPINYALDSASAMSGFFDIGRESGIIKLKRSLDLIREMQDVSPSWNSLTIYASEVPDATSYDRLWPPMYTKVDVALSIVDDYNEAPKFLGASTTLESGLVLKGSIEENSRQGTAIRWYSNSSQKQPMIVDFGNGSNGTFEISLEGPDSAYFGLIPLYVIIKQTTFSIVVVDSNNSAMDYESGRRVFELDVVATDFGKPRLSSRIKCIIDLIDVNDNYPRFTQNIYSSFIYEDAPVGTVVAIIKAHDIDSGNFGKIRYTSMSGLGREMFSLDQDTGAVVLIDSTGIDREIKSDYTFMIEVRDENGFGHKNYSELRVNINDINDNAPVFLQPQYDAVMLPDGSLTKAFYVKASDADQEGTINSQIAYEIIGGNYYEQFAIDSNSGLIYMSSNENNQDMGPKLPQLPPVLIEQVNPHHHANDANSAMTHEMEDDSSVSDRHHLPPVNHTRPKLNWPRSANESSIIKSSNNVERSYSAASSSSNNIDLQNSSDQPMAYARQTNANAYRFPPLTTLIVRARDFGIPIRSSTVKVNIHNQALLNRSISIILNGTIDQLNAKRDLIERGFAALTGAKTSIESIDALSESSSLSVARARLMIPIHSLVDLTDLSPLMFALDHGQHSTEEHKVILQGHSASSGSSSSQLQTQISSIPTSFFNHGDLGPGDQPYHVMIWILMLLIIIVVISILLLLLWWLCCNCTSSKVYQEKSITKEKNSNKKHSFDSDIMALKYGTTSKQSQTNPKYVDNGGQKNDISKSTTLAEGSKASQTLSRSRPAELNPLSNSLRPDHLSMYNGQVWFESRDNELGMASRPHSRRASSAPSGGSIEQNLFASRKATGEFFPNTMGFVQNLTSLGSNRYALMNHKSTAHGHVFRRHRKKRVVPLVLAHDMSKKDLTGIDNMAYLDVEQADSSSPLKTQAEYYLASVGDDGRIIFDDSRSNSSSSNNSRISQHELLGFDRSGTPIIAGTSSMLFDKTSQKLVQPKKAEIMYIRSPVNETSKKHDNVNENLPPVSDKKIINSTSNNLEPPSVKKDQQPRDELLPGHQSLRRSKTEYLLSKQTGSKPSSGPTVTLDPSKLTKGSQHTDAPTQVKTNVDKTHSDIIQNGRAGNSLSDSNRGHMIIHSESTDSSQAEDFNIKNAELMEKKSVFAIAYSGVTTDNLS